MKISLTKKVNLSTYINCNSQLYLATNLLSKVPLTVPYPQGSSFEHITFTLSLIFKFCAGNGLANSANKKIDFDFRDI